MQLKNARYLYSTKEKTRRAIICDRSFSWQFATLPEIPPEFPRDQLADSPEAKPLGFLTNAGKCASTRGNTGLLSRGYEPVQSVTGSR